MSEFEAFSSGETDNTYVEPCSICGRTFNPQSLARHENICAKTNAKKRKTFNATKQRLEGTGAETLKKTKTREPPKPRGLSTNSQQPKKNNWRQKHEDFINAIRGAKGVQKAMDAGLPLPPPPPPTINPDYVQCPYCSRRFNEGAAQRHIDFCKEQKARLPKNKPSATAVARQSTRLQYKAPRPKAKTSPSQEMSPSYSSPSTRTPASKRSSGMDPYSPNGGGGGGGGGSGGINGTAIGRGRGSRSYQNHDRYQSGDYLDDVDSPPPSGRPLRTGRNAATLSGARELSANRGVGGRSSLRQRVPSNENLSRISNTGSSSNSRPSSLYSNNSPSSDNRYNGRQAESGYNSNSDLESPGSKRIGSGAAKFCHECGTRYPVPAAKFCCECGIKRIYVQ